MNLEEQAYFAKRKLPVTFSFYEGSLEATFDFYEKYQEVVGAAIFSSGTYFITALKNIDQPMLDVVMQNHVKVIHRAHIYLLENSLLREHKLCCARIDLAPSCLLDKKTRQQYGSFLTKTLNLFYSLIAEYVNKVRTHLSLRNVAAEKLIHNDAVRMQFSEVYVLMDKYKRCITHDAMPVASVCLLDVCALLAKLAGGRAFLSKNIIELQSLLFVFHDVYFREVSDEKFKSL